MRYFYRLSIVITLAAGIWVACGPQSQSERSLPEIEDLKTRRAPQSTDEADATKPSDADQNTDQPDDDNSGVAEIVIDNAMAQQKGTWETGDLADGFYAHDYYHNDGTEAWKKKVTYTPEIITAGQYEVFAYWPAAPEHSEKAVYYLYSLRKRKGFYVNQQEDGSSWQSLGVFSFAAGKSLKRGSVVITGKRRTRGYVVADAMRFVYRAPLPSLPPEN